MHFFDAFYNFRLARDVTTNNPMTDEDDGSGRTYAMIKMANEFKVYSSDSDTEHSQSNGN